MYQIKVLFICIICMRLTLAKSEKSKKTATNALCTYNRHYVAPFQMLSYTLSDICGICVVVTCPYAAQTSISIPSAGPL